MALNTKDTAQKIIAGHFPVSRMYSRTFLEKKLYKRFYKPHYSHHISMVSMFLFEGRFYGPLLSYRKIIAAFKPPVKNNPGQ